LKENFVAVVVEDNLIKFVFVWGKIAKKEKNIVIELVE
jgi:hypothetical protein